jgi:hypothetical protein
MKIKHVNNSLDHLIVNHSSGHILEYLKSKNFINTRKRKVFTVSLN